MLKSQLSTSNFFLTQVNMLSELSDCIQRRVVLKTQPTDLQDVKPNTKVKKKTKLKSVFI